MIILILIAVFGTVFAFFATQNSFPVNVTVAIYSFENVPLYLVVLATIILTLLVAGLFYFVKSLSSSLTMSEKDHELKKIKEELNETTKTVHKLELENVKLKTELDEEDVDENSI